MMQKDIAELEEVLGDFKRHLEKETLLYIKAYKDPKSYELSHRRNMIKDWIEGIKDLEFVLSVVKKET